MGSMGGSFDLVTGQLPGSPRRSADGLSKSLPMASRRRSIVGPDGSGGATYVRPRTVSSDDGRLAERPPRHNTNQIHILTRLGL